MTYILFTNNLCGKKIKISTESLIFNSNDKKILNLNKIIFNDIEINDLLYNINDSKNITVNSLIKKYNMKNIFKSLNNIIYNIECISVNNMYQKPFEYNKTNKIINMLAYNNYYLKYQNLKKSGLHLIPGHLLSERYFRCYICGVCIYGKLNADYGINHAFHSPYCPFVRIKINYIYLSQQNIMIDNNSQTSESSIDYYPKCTLCDNRAIIITFDCMHVSMCGNCFMIFKTCNVCDIYTTEFMIINTYGIGVKINFNINPKNDIRESNNVLVNIPCMHLVCSKSKSICNHCYGFVIGFVAVKFVMM